METKQDLYTNNQAINLFYEHLNNKEIKFYFFKNEFNYRMAETSLSILKNINYLIDHYRETVGRNEENGEKILNLYGILQGLFVGIDCLYTIGKASTMNKLMINLNQNITLREIKHVRNDVVGHPSYRFYSDDTIGFCALDLEHIQNSKFSYLVYTPSHQSSYEVNSREIDMIDVINSYFEESNAILTQTVNLFAAIENKEHVDISSMISLLAYRFSEGKLDLALLSQIRKTYQEYLKLAESSNNRVLWRLRLIEYLFKFADKNDYTTYLTYQEMFKLYSLVYSFEKKLDPKLRYKFVKYETSAEFKSLKNKVSKIKRADFNPSELHDARHPLYHHHMKILFDSLRGDKEVEGLLNWIRKMIQQQDLDILYLIGSELKK